MENDDHKTFREENLGELTKCPACGKMRPYSNANFPICPYCGHEGLSEDEVEDAFWDGWERGYKKKYGNWPRRLGPEDADLVIDGKGAMEVLDAKKMKTLGAAENGR
jgi:hypothetical protein